MIINFVYLNLLPLFQCHKSFPCVEQAWWQLPTPEHQGGLLVAGTDGPGGQVILAPIRARTDGSMTGQLVRCRLASNQSRALFV